MGGLGDHGGAGSRPARRAAGRAARPGQGRPGAGGRRGGEGARRCYSLSSGNWSSSAILNEPRRFFKGCPPRCIVGRRLSLRGRFECGARCPAAPRRVASRRARPGRPRRAGRAAAAPRGRAAPRRPRPGRSEEAGRPRREARRAPPLPGPGAGARGGGWGGRASSRVPRAPLPARAARPLWGSLPARGPRPALQLRELQAVCSEWGRGGKEVGGRPGRAEAGRGGGTCGPGAGKEAFGDGSRCPRGADTRSRFFTAPQTHVSSASPSCSLLRKAQGGSGEEGSGRSPTARRSRTRGPGRGHPPAQGAWKTDLERSRS